MDTRRPWIKVGLVLLGLAGAFAVASLAVDLRQRATQGPEFDAMSGMYAFGDLVLGVTVFSVLALAPLGTALYWLRPVPRFWTGLAWAGACYALTGPLALAASTSLRSFLGTWAILGDARIGTMPLSALALAVCGILAPRPRNRWILMTAAAADGALFATILGVRVVLPVLR